MRCKKCGFFNADNAKFCSDCGARLDGKKDCRFCGKQLDEESAYCSYCGAKMESGSSFINSRSVFKDSSTPSVNGNSPFASVRAAYTREKKTFFDKDIWGWFSIAGDIFVCLGMLCAFIFMFFIGARVTAGAGTGVSFQSCNIFYYFGEYYDKIVFPDTSSKTATLKDWLIVFVNNAAVSKGVFGTLIGAGTLLAVLSFSIAACVSYANTAIHKIGAKGDTWASCAIGSFLVGALSFYSIHNMEKSEYDASLMIGREYTFYTLSGVTLAGIIICAVFLGLFMLCKLIAKNKKLLNWVWLGKIVAGLGVVAFSIVAIIFATKTGWYLALEDKGDLETATLNYTMAASYLASRVVFDFSELHYYELTSNLENANALSCLAQISVIVIVGCSVFALCANLKAISDGEASSGMSAAFFAMLAAIMLLIFSIFYWNASSNVFNLLATETGSENFANLKTNYTSQILLVVFTVLNFIATTVQLSLQRALLGEDEEIAT